MKLSWRTLTRKQTLKRLYPELRGRVFHITSVENFLSIMRAGMIQHNRDGIIKSNGTYNAYFKNRGCVSFCDLYGNTQIRKSRESALSRYNIFNQAGGEYFVYLFLTPTSHSKLISWKKWKEEKAWREMVVPHLEAGYPGFVPLEEIEEAMLIHVPISIAEHGIRARLLSAMQSAHIRSSQSSSQSVS